MAVQARRYTVEEFDALVQEPDNADRLFEFIGGEVVEVPSNPYVSQIAARISGHIFIYLAENDIGHLTGEAGGYMVSGERYAPDVAFIAREKQPELAQEGYNPAPPDLAVEVLSPTDDPRLLRIKIVNYLRAGTTVWIVNPAQRQVEVYRPGRAPEVVDKQGALEGDDVLPGFELAVKDIFPE
jgi:Uma2 family endonuclease